MACQIETRCEPDGCWIAEVPALPGLQVYGHSEEETLAIAKALTAMLLQEGTPEAEGNTRILAFYPGHGPGSTGIEAA